MRKIIGTTAFVLLLCLAPATFWLWLAPPELIRVAAGYTAKIVCSNVFLAQREAGDVLRIDVQAPGHPLLRFMRVHVDRDEGSVRAGLFGFMGGGLAVVSPDVGCAVLPTGRLADRPAPARRAMPNAAPPISERPDRADLHEPDVEVMKVIRDDVLAGPGMRAIVVVRDGQLMAERYAQGFGRETPQLGWSMTKTVTAGLVGILVMDGRLSLERAALWPKGDARADITLGDLLSMSSGLEFNEGYGAVSDVTRMLYLEPNMAAFARAKPLIHPVGSTWSYSSGTALIISSALQLAGGGDAAAFARSRLFDVLGMTSAVIEADAAGTPVGSSYMYATPRDWARFGQLLAQDGVWEGRQILPPGFVAMMAAPAPASGGEYGRGMVWRWLTHSERRGENPDAAAGMPADIFWMVGHDGQYEAIVPSRHLVIVRMGLTPQREHYMPQKLLQAVLAATEEPGTYRAVTPVSNDHAENRQ